MSGTIEQIFVAAGGGAAMQSVEVIEAIAGKGLCGDRYAERTGYWSGIDECQVTLIRGEDLDKIAAGSGVAVHRGEHRRNLVTRGVDFGQLADHQFQIGAAILAFDRPRPPCRYIASLTEPGMTQALINCGGICATVLQSGTIRLGDQIVLE